MEVILEANLPDTWLNGLFEHVVDTFLSLFIICSRPLAALMTRTYVVNYENTKYFNLSPCWKQWHEPLHRQLCREQSDLDCILIDSSSFLLEIDELVFYLPHAIFRKNFYRNF